MKIYIDYIFIENFWVMYVLLKQCSILTNKNIKKLNHLVACTISAIYVCVMVIFKINFLNYIVMKILLCVVVVYIVFSPKKINQYIKYVGIFLITSAINLGVFYIIRNFLDLKPQTILYKLIIYGINLSLCIIICKKMWKMNSIKLTESTLIYNASVYIEDKEYVYKGFMDTGNNAYSYEYSIPIVIAEIQDAKQRKMLEKLESFYMEISSINGSAWEKVYIPTNFVINSEKINVGIVFSEQKLDSSFNYNMILNFRIFEKNMRGICI